MLFYGILVRPDDLWQCLRLRNKDTQHRAASNHEAGMTIALSTIHHEDDNTWMQCGTECRHSHRDDPSSSMEEKDEIDSQPYDQKKKKQHAILLHNDNAKEHQDANPMLLPYIPLYQEPIPYPSSDEENVPGCENHDNIMDDVDATTRIDDHAMGKHDVLDGAMHINVSSHDDPKDVVVSTDAFTFISSDQDDAMGSDHSHCYEQMELWMTPWLNHLFLTREIDLDMIVLMHKQRVPLATLQTQTKHDPHSDNHCIHETTVILIGCALFVMDRDDMLSDKDEEMAAICAQPEVVDTVAIVPMTCRHHLIAQWKEKHQKACAAVHDAWQDLRQQLSWSDAWYRCAFVTMHQDNHSIYVMNK